MNSVAGAAAAIPVTGISVPIPANFNREQAQQMYQVGSHSPVLTLNISPAVASVYTRMT